MLDGEAVTGVAEEASKAVFRLGGTSGHAFATIDAEC
jgi:hypothetical protein